MIIKYDDKMLSRTFSFMAAESLIVRSSNYCFPSFGLWLGHSSKRSLLVKGNSPMIFVFEKKSKVYDQRNATLLQRPDL